ALERGEQVVQPAGAALRPGPGLERKCEIPLAGPGKAPFPFAVCTVKNKYQVAGRQPQDAGEVVGLGGVQRDRCARTERSGNEQTRASEVVARHEVEIQVRSAL